MSRKPMDPVKLNLRFTEALRSRLEKAAAHNNRSMNEEIIRRLEDSFKPDDFLAALDLLSERATVRIGNKVRKGGRWVDEDKP